VADDLLSAFRAGYELSSAAFNEGDLDRALAGLPEDLEWHAVSEDPEQEVLRGPAEIKHFFQGFRSVFEKWRVEPIDFERLSDRSILVHHIIRGTSRGAGVPVEVETWEVWEFEQMRPVRVRQFLSRAEALAVDS
jgi:ketosteroid isomerase-like protein